MLFRQKKDSTKLGIYILFGIQNFYHKCKKTKKERNVLSQQRRSSHYRARGTIEQIGVDFDELLNDSFETSELGDVPRTEQENGEYVEESRDLEKRT